MEIVGDLESIANEVRICRLCPLYESRRIAVPGEGPADARLMFVGEAPGREEDLCGRPFVGRAGKVFDAALKRAGIVRDRVYITSIVKCRPPDNRQPQKNEYGTCIPTYLRRQIAVVRPVVICLLGGMAVKAMLGVTRLAEVRGRTIQTNMLYFPTYHPAGAGRNPAWARALQADLGVLRRLLYGMKGGPVTPLDGT